MRVLTDALAIDKNVLLRIDANEPIIEGKLASSLRIAAAVPTLTALHRAKSVLLLAHLGRPDGRTVPELTLRPVAEQLSRLLRIKTQPSIATTPFGKGFQIHNQTILLENIRFRPEEVNLDRQFAKQLALAHDLFVNDAFSAPHPAVSTTVLPSLLPSCYGLRFAEEITVLRRLRETPVRPLVVIIGGAKIEDKLGVVEHFAKTADQILIGGAAAKVARDKQLFTEYSQVYLAEDGPGFAQGREQDIGPLTIFRFERAIESANTIFWSGPLGMIENTRYQEGTRTIAQAITKSQATTVVGGGDTNSFLERLDLLNKMTFYSLGGSAMLTYLATGSLPTIEALEENEKKFNKI